MARPIPDEAPVTRAVLLVSCISVICCQGFDGFDGFDLVVFLVMMVGQAPIFHQHDALNDLIQKANP